MSAAVSLAAAHELSPALRLLFPSEPALPRDLLDSSAVLVARDAGGGVCAAALARTLPGALGLVWPPRAEIDEQADALVLAACDWLLSSGVKVAQAFAAEREAASMIALERSGFRRITRLISLRGDLHFASAPASLAFVAESPPFSDVFRSTLLATDQGTLDCPELNGDRTPEELFASFVESAAGTTWHLARHAGQPIGVMVLANGESANEVELSYLGLVPSARGRGLGRELVAFARLETRRRGASSLTVSVDSRNNPALQLYRSRGFVEVERRVVWLAHFSRFIKPPAHNPSA
jgi:mycothiol synthase